MFTHGPPLVNERSVNNVAFFCQINDKAARGIGAFSNLANHHERMVMPVVPVPVRCFCAGHTRKCGKRDQSQEEG